MIPSFHAGVFDAAESAHTVLDNGQPFCYEALLTVCAYSPGSSETDAEDQELLFTGLPESNRQLVLNNSHESGNQDSGQNGDRKIAWPLSANLMLFPTAGAYPGTPVSEDRTSL